MDKEEKVLPNGEKVEFYPDTHTYIVRGVEVPSITTLLKKVYGDTYASVNPELLKRSADYGTRVHDELDSLIRMREQGLEIESLCSFQETRNYFNLVEPLYHIEPVLTEQMVVLYNDEGVPVAAGRFDILCKVQDQLTLADFKTTTAIHRQSVTAQLNLYLRAARQSGYLDPSTTVKLGVIHLSGESAKYVELIQLGESFYKKFVN